jgi:hypothetical protein
VGRWWVKDWQLCNLFLGQFAGHPKVRVEATIGYGLAIHNAGHRANPADVDALPVQAVALAIDALDSNADGRESLNHPRFRVCAKKVVGHAVRL